VVCSELPDVATDEGVFVNEFLKQLGADDARILRLLFDGVAFKQLPKNYGDVTKYVVYSHAGDDLSWNETPFAIEGMIHKLKKAGYGHFKMYSLSPGTDAGLTLRNFNILGWGTHGTWSPGIEITKEFFMTNEQIAIRQHLSKERPFNGGCGCMGAYAINADGSRNYERDRGTPEFIITVKLGEDRVKSASGLKSTFQLTIEQTREILKSGEYTYSAPYEGYAKALCADVQKFGCSTSIEGRDCLRSPLCSCMMAWVELVNGVYYQIEEVRSPDGITHTATELGPIGGPYKTK